jgi:hypothetical protein
VSTILGPVEAGMQASGNQNVANSNTQNALGQITNNLQGGQTNLASLYNNYKDPSTQAGITAPQINTSAITPVTAPTLSSVYGGGGLGSVPGVSANNGGSDATLQAIMPYLKALLSSVGTGGGGGTSSSTTTASTQPSTQSSTSAALTPDQNALIASTVQQISSGFQGQTGAAVNSQILQALANTGKFTSAQLAGMAQSGAISGTGTWGSGPVTPADVATWTSKYQAGANNAANATPYNDNAVPTGGVANGATTSGYAPSGYAVNTPIAAQQMAGIIPNTYTAPPALGASSQSTTSATPAASAAPASSVTSLPAYRQALAQQAGVPQRAVAA